MVGIEPHQEDTDDKDRSSEEPRDATIAVVLGALMFSGGPVAATAPPDTPFRDAITECAAQPDTARIVDQVVMLDDGHSLLVDAGDDFGIGVACVLAALGRPEWPRHRFTGWVTYASTR